jgi:hypothetical protein
MIALAVSPILVGVLLGMREIHERRELLKEVTDCAKEMEGLITGTREHQHRQVEALIKGLIDRQRISEAQEERRRVRMLSPAGWLLDRGASVLGVFPGARLVLQYLAGDARGLDAAPSELIRLKPEGRDTDDWLAEVAAVLAVLQALELLAYDRAKDAVSLAPLGMQLATRLWERAADPHPSAPGRGHA